MSTLHSADGRFWFNDFGGGNQLLAFHCPGCECGHAFEVGEGQRWTWNGNIDRPTCKPSLVVPPSETGDRPRCHLWLTAGRLQFLGDCEHELSGTIQQPPPQL